MVILQVHAVIVLYLLLIKLLEIESKISFTALHPWSRKISTNYIQKFYSYDWTNVSIFLRNRNRHLQKHNLNFEIPEIRVKGLNRKFLAQEQS